MIKVDAQTTQCKKCGVLPDDVIDVLFEVLQLRTEKYRGTVELHFDGSGRIKSRKKIDFREVGKIQLTTTV